VYKTAEAYFDKSLAANPKNGEALIGKARIRWQYQDPKGAEGLLNQAIAEYPRWAAPLVERARVYREAGFLKEALTDLDTAKALDGGNYWVAIDRGNVLLDLGNKAEALKEFDRAHQLDPKNFLSYVYSSGIRDEQGDYAGAERDYAALASLKPDYYFAFEGLGTLKIKDGQWAEAKDAFLQAYVRSGGKSNYALLAALCWLHTGKTADLRTFLEKVLTQVSRETTEWYMLRLYYEQSGDTDISVRIDTEKNANTRARMLYYLAQYYDIKGNKTLADKYFLRVRDLGRQSILEWRLNEWALEGRKL
jgi:predicted Zn-dependent protease